MLTGAMPARIMPSGANGHTGTSPTGVTDAPTKRQQTSNFTVAISLASLFDFEKTGFVSKENWERGMTTLMMDELGMDPKIWSHLVDIHGSKDMASKGQLDVQKLNDIVPIDPRVAVLLNAIVKGLVGMRDFVKRSMRKEDKDVKLKRSRAVINIRRRILYPVLKAWRQLINEKKSMFKRSVRRAIYSEQNKAFRTWLDAIAQYQDEKAEAKAREKQMRRVRVAVQRMQNAKVTAAWNSWTEMWEERKKFVRAVARLKNRPLSMAYNSWIEMYEHGLFLRKLAKRTLNRDLNKGVRTRARRGSQTISL